MELLNRKKPNREANLMTYTKILFNLSTNLNSHMKNLMKIFFPVSPHWEVI